MCVSNRMPFARGLWRGFGLAAILEATNAITEAQRIVSARNSSLEFCRKFNVIAYRIDMCVCSYAMHIHAQLGAAMLRVECVAT